MEGRADLWRLGYGAVCLFGIAFTMYQVNLLASRYKQVFIMFDAEETLEKRKITQKQALKLAALLTARGIKVEILELEGYKDPGDMPDREAHYLMKDIGLK